MHLKLGGTTTLHLDTFFQLYFLTPILAILKMNIVVVAWMLQYHPAEGTLNI